MAHWSSRELCILANSLNHLIYAALFLVRSLFYPDIGSGDRPFYYESKFLGWLVPPGMASLCGWKKNYDDAVILRKVLELNSEREEAAKVYGETLASFVSNQQFMFYYQIAEGTFHCMICVGSLWLFFSKSVPRLLTLYHAGLLLEIMIMDIPYFIAFSCLPFQHDFPGYYGLMTYVVFIHHLTVLPDILSALCEWGSSKMKTKEA
eukprot:gnl/MRDRNA2_/MRDRNA2_94796_c0_seq1.p1 gnl/MRDRNA2_/MRDRNA2_94796_c0~~gnl/MRDRNA2_/MRDRNA2_94796_c0_seq1.p1  ORF type:complete len:206 (+),score=17.50 gnl/MRDRNA2_/MRDRNA2_94796_c0_seq1:63-680(+)